jgi:hypothetical protein
MPSSIALERHELKNWIAPRDLTPGEFYADAIVRALNIARTLVLVLSEYAATSPRGLREVERTSAKRHSIISFRTDSISLPPALEYLLSASHCDVAEFLATLPAPRGRLQEVQKNMPTRIAAMQPHCSSIIRSRSTSAAKASVTSG